MLCGFCPWIVTALYPDIASVGILGRMDVRRGVESSVEQIVRTYGQSFDLLEVTSDADTYDGGLGDVDVDV